MKAKIQLKSKARKQFTPLISYAEDNGWGVERTNGGHLRFSKENRKPVFTSFTPSDHNAIPNALADLKRADRQALSSVSAAVY